MTHFPKCPDPEVAQPVYIDTHAHLDEPVFDGDRRDALRRATEAGVGTILNIAYSPERWVTSSALDKTYPMISIAYGLHPTLTSRFTGQTISILRDLIQANRGIAIGETGFDFFWPGFDAIQQERVFVAQLELAGELDLPAIIHQRSAEETCTKILSTAPSNVPIVLHSFDGTLNLGRQGIDRGYYFGVGGLMTRANATHVREILAAVPLERLLLETDSPFLTPAKVKVRRNEPANIPIIAGHLAELRGVSIDMIASQTTENANRLFRFTDHPFEQLPSPVRSS